MQLSDMIGMARDAGREEGLEEGRAEELFNAVDMLVKEPDPDEDKACRLLHADLSEYRLLRRRKVQGADSSV